MANSQYNPDLAPQKLKTWIDGDHAFDLRDESANVFLHDPEFTQDDLKHGFVYARNKLEEAANGLLEHPESVGGEPGRRWDIIGALENLWKKHAKILDEKYMEVGKGERALFDTDWRFKDEKEKDVSQEKEFRRTIAALCRLRVKVERKDEDVKQAVLAKQ